MFKRLMIFVLVVSIASPAFAERILLISGGRYFLIELNGATPTISLIETVIDAGGVVTTPPPVATLRGKVTQLTTATNDPLIANGIATGAYATIRERLATESISWEQALSVIRAATDLAISQSDDRQAWATWRTEIGKIIDEQKGAGLLTTNDQQVKFLLDIEEGMRAAFPNSAIDFEKLLKLIRTLIDFILPLLGNNADIGEPAEEEALFVPQRRWNPFGRGWVDSGALVLNN